MKVVFRVDASLEIGTGHVMRCLTLAHMLKKNGANVEFICRQHNGNLIDKIYSNGFIVHELCISKESEIDARLTYAPWLGVTQQTDADDCIDRIKTRIDWLIVDHYSLDYQWQKRMRPCCKKLMVIDDLADRKHQCDILLDQTFGRKKEDYLELVTEDCQLLLGSQYALLRPEFAEWRGISIERRSRPELKQLLINMGGIDIDNFTGQVLIELKNCNLPSDLNITIVMGGSAPHLDSVKSMAIELPYKTEVKVDVDNMAEIMANADIAIGAAGSSTWERCCLGLPTIQFVIAKNQLFSAETLAQHNIVKLAKEVKKAAYLLESSPEWMKSFGLAAEEVCDGMGSNRVFNKMTDYKIILEKFGEFDLCSYVNLNENDKMLTLKMRNHPQVKKWMYNQDNITKKEHFEFIESLASNINRCYFLVKQEEKLIGSVNFKNIRNNKPAIFGFYANPFEPILGAGRILELVSLHFIFTELNLKKLTLEVLSNNKQVLNLHKKFGFKIVREKNKNGIKVFCMEKKSTDWK